MKKLHTIIIKLRYYEIELTNENSPNIPIFILKQFFLIKFNTSRDAIYTKKLQFFHKVSSNKIVLTNNDNKKN